MSALHDFRFCSERNEDVPEGSEQSYVVSVMVSIEHSGSIGGEGEAVMPVCLCGNANGRRWCLSPAGSTLPARGGQIWACVYKVETTDFRDGLAGEVKENIKDCLNIFA